MRRPTRASLSLAESCLLSLWLGASFFFAAAVAPAAFEVLPTSALAGALVGRLLPVLFGAGIVVGLAVLAVEVRASRRRAVAAGVLLAACAVAQFVIGGRIERLRARSEQPIAALAPQDPRRVAFGRLHALSVGALGAAMLAAAAAVATGRRNPVGGDGGA